jgi:Sporulation and spore germination/Immunoglobulin-like domain of bacterial spore germination
MDERRGSRRKVDLRELGKETIMTKRLILITTALAAILVSAGPATAAPQAGPRMTLQVWLERGGTLWLTKRTVARTPGVARAALGQLFAGPNAAEAAAGVGSAVPAGTRLRGISTSGRTATVDVSRAFAAAGGRASVRMRVAQLVFTATQFHTIDRVRLEVVGQTVHSIAGVPVPQPAAAANFYRLLPMILVARPAIGARIPAVVTVAGSADVFEAVVHIRIRNARGRLVSATHVLATCGTGCRGTYTAKLTYHVLRRQRGTVVINGDSGGGTRLPVTRVPVLLSVG